MLLSTHWYSGHSVLHTKRVLFVWSPECRVCMQGVRRNEHPVYVPSFIHGSLSISISTLVCWTFCEFFSFTIVCQCTLSAVKLNHALQVKRQKPGQSPSAMPAPKVLPLTKAPSGKVVVATPAPTPGKIKLMARPQVKTTCCHHLHCSVLTLCAPDITMFATVVGPGLSDKLESRCDSSSFHGSLEPLPVS